MIIERIKFYADTPGGKNKYFCFNNVSILTVPACFEKYWKMGFRIKAAWIEAIDNTNKEVLHNTRIHNILAYETEYLICTHKKTSPNYAKVHESLRTECDS